MTLRGGTLPPPPVRRSNCTRMMRELRNNSHSGGSTLCKTLSPESTPRSVGLRLRSPFPDNNMASLPSTGKNSVLAPVKLWCGHLDRERVHRNHARLRRAKRLHQRGLAIRYCLAIQLQKSFGSRKRTRKHTAGWIASCYRMTI